MSNKQSSPASTSKRAWPQRLSALLSDYGPYLALVVLLLVCAISSPYFRRPQNLINITRQISYSGIIAIGMTFVIIGGGIDLSVGSLLAFAGSVAILAMNFCEHPVLAVAVAIVVAVAVGTAGGALNGALVTIGKIPPFIVTLGTLSIFRSLTLYIANAGLVTSKHELFGRLGAAAFLGIPLPAWTLLLLTIVAAIALRQTRFGRYICAVGANERVARYAAIRTDIIKFSSYVIAGALAGVSAVLLGARLSSLSSTTAGLSYELDAIAAAIIGGTAMAGGRGAAFGTLAGALILGIVSNVLDMWGVSVNLQGTVKGVVIIIAVLIQRQR
jgi:ribose transport system permease protein